MPNRSEITQAVIDSLGDTEWTLDLALRNWWLNIRESGGLRLNLTGYRVFRELAQLECWEIPVDDQTMGAANLMLLDRKMTCPYALFRRRGERNLTLIMFGSQEATMAMLYGDTAKWLASLRRSP